MNLMSLVAKLSLDSKEYSDGLAKSEQEASSFGSSLGKGLGTAAKVAGVAIGAAATAVGSLTKSAVENYAEYEQLVGGVETLFGAQGMTIEEYADSVGKSTTEVQGDYDRLMRAQNKMFSQAANAYKTAGMSANDYMETATSFAASLVSSLGGNTEEAANVANTAITDMSDNANKMGTDISMIQNAYQGFAKQNYTMLDNLKLGYGGTKAEMTRLIEDANKLKKAHGEMADLSIDSYADIVEAIHLVQDEMGITGTTAKEASTTIQGSLSSARGAWQNLLTGIADDNQDFGVLVDNFIETLVGTVDEGGERVGGVINNIIPRVETALKGISKLISEAVPELLQIIPPLISDLLPDLVQAAVGLVQSFVEVLPDVITAITDVLPSLLDIIGQGIVDSMSTLTEKIPDIADALSQTLSDVLDWVIENAGPLIEGFADFLSTLLTEGIGILSDNKDKIVEALFAVIKAVVNAAIENPELVAMIVGMKALTSMGSSIVSTIGKGIQTAESGLSNALSGVINKLPVSPGVLGAIVGAATAVGVALGNALDGALDKAAQNSQYYSTIKDLQEVAKSLAGEIRNTRDAYYEQLDASEASAGAAEHLMGQIESLMASYDGSIEQQTIIKGLVDEMNNALPGLALSWDGVTNSLNIDTEAVYAYIEAQKQEAQLQAAREYYIETLKQQYDAEANTRRSYESLIGLTQEYGVNLNALTSAIHDGTISDLEFADIMAQSNLNIAEGSELYDNLKDSVDAYLASATEKNVLEKDAEEAYNRWGEAIKQAAENTAEAGEQIGTATGQISESVQTLMNDWATTFEQEIPADLQQAAEAASNAGYEIPQGLVTGIDTGNIEVTSAIDRMNALVDFTTAVQNAGLGGTEVSQSFVNSWLAGEYDWTTANNYLNGLIDFTTAINEAMSSGTEVTTEFVNGLLNQYGLDGVINAAEVLGKSAKPTIVPNEIHEVGASVAQETASGMSENEYQVQDAAQSMVDTITGTMEPLPGEMNATGDESGSNLESAYSSWQGAISGAVDETYNFFYDTLGSILTSKMYDWGYEAGTEYRNALDDRYDAITGVASDIASGIETEFDPLPGWLESAGYDGGAGLYNGFQSWEGALYSLASNIAWNISSTIRRAFNSHSPSRVMMAIGDDVGEGLKIGIEESGERAISAAEGIAESIIDASAVTGSYDAAVSPQNRQEQLYSMLAQYLPEIVNRPVILDSGELVGAIGPKMSERFQTYDVIGKRGGTAYA